MPGGPFPPRAAWRRDTVDGISVHIRNRDGVIRGCLRFRNAVATKIQRKAARSCVEVPHMNTAQLLGYSQRPRIHMCPKDLCGCMNLNDADVNAQSV